VSLSSPFRQGERECGTFARLALQGDAPAVQFDELARQREAESRPFLLVRVVAAHLAELFEHRLLILSRDTDAGIVHRYDDIIAVVARRHLDAAAVGGELHGVGQQV